MLRNYLLLAVKVLLRRKFYTFVSLFGIAFTLTILLVATALADHVLAATPPESRLGRMLFVSQARMSGPNWTSSGSPGYALLDRYARELPGVERFAIASELEHTISYVDDVRVVTRLKRADPAYWEILDFRFLEGGPYTTEDAAEGRFVAVINASTRRRFFGNGPALGGSIRLDDQSFRVVGVVADVGPTRLNSFAEAWVPIETIKSTAYRSSLRAGFNGILLARDRDAFPMIKAEFQRRLADAELTDPMQFDKLESSADTLIEALARDVTGNRDAAGPSLSGIFAWIALGALLFMALPAINLINLSLSRILERSSEIGVRKAFGASSRTLVAQFVVESVVLSLIGGAVGFVLAGLSLNLLNRSDLIPYAAFTLNLRIFAAGLVLSVFFGLLSGAYPAWRMSRLHPVQSIQGRAS